MISVRLTVALVLAGFAIGIGPRLLRTGAAEPVYDPVNPSDALTINPGGWNVWEYVCVRDYTHSPDLIDEAAIQSDLIGWLTAANGWENASGSGGSGGEVNFVSHSVSAGCSRTGDCYESNPATIPGGNCVARVFVDIHDADTYPCTGGLGCAPTGFTGEVRTTLDGHPHRPRSRISIFSGRAGNGWADLDSANKQRLMMHEMGHLLGLGHKGVQRGITTIHGFLWDGPWHQQPRPEEYEQVRSHILHEAAPADAPCISFTTDHTLRVGWWDSAPDDTAHSAELRQDGVLKYLLTQGEEIDTGNRVTWHYDPPGTPDLSGNWIVRAKVSGGPDGAGGPSTDPPPVDSPIAKVTGINPPCLLRVKKIQSTQDYEMRLSFYDGSDNEEYWEVQRAIMHSAYSWCECTGGNLPTWVLLGSQIPANSGTGLVYFTQMADNGASPADDLLDWACYRVRAVGPVVT